MYYQKKKKKKKKLSLLIGIFRYFQSARNADFWNLKAIAKDKSQNATMKGHIGKDKDTPKTFCDKACLDEKFHHIKKIYGL